MIESSICVPTDLGSKATLTPVPKIPLDETPAHPDNIKPKNNIKINLIFFLISNNNHKFLFLKFYFFR